MASLPDDLAAGAVHEIEGGVRLNLPHGQQAQRGSGLELIDAPHVRDLAAYDARRAAVVQKADQGSDAVHPAGGAGGRVLQADMGAGGGGEYAVLKVQRQAAAGDGHPGHLLDRRNRAGAVLELELNVLVVELAAEAPGKLRGVLHRQVQPAAVKAAAGPEVDGAV